MEVSGQIRAPAALPQVTDHGSKRIRRGEALNLAGLGILEERQYLDPAGIRSPTCPVHIMVPTATTLPPDPIFKTSGAKMSITKNKNTNEYYKNLLRHERRERWR
jgi:hypothetical protein